jgi:hypothetical protein
VTITNVSAPPGTWRFGSLTWKDFDGHAVRSPIAVNAVALVAPEEVTGAGADGSASYDVTFGYSGTFLAAPQGLVGPALTLSTVLDDPDNSFTFNEPGTSRLAFLAEIPAGTVHAQWSLFDVYNDGAHDLDMYLYYCPNLSCSLVDSSLNATSNERVGVSFPLNNPSINDPYAVFVHGFNTAGGVGGPPAQFILFRHLVGASAGNMTVNAPSTATVGDTATIGINWMGLFTGPGGKQAGAVSYSDGTAIRGLTIVNITNDPGGRFCDFVGPCPP